MWIEIINQSGRQNQPPLSHPSRVCGLKFPITQRCFLSVQSHPSRVCGLKSIKPNLFVDFECVAPFAGVWIEIIYSYTRDYLTMSHPSRVCGLKYRYEQIFQLRDLVAPFAGVWIEISISKIYTNHVFRSHPSRVCGLK